MLKTSTVVRLGRSTPRNPRTKVYTEIALVGTYIRYYNTKYNNMHIIFCLRTPPHSMYFILPILYYYINNCLLLLLLL